MSGAARPSPLVIVGAGPFGLALAAYARRHGIEPVVLGKPMEFWKSNMPRGMFLRSACDWHYDPFDEDTIVRFVQEKGLQPRLVEPLALDFYLGYPEWFRARKGIEVTPRLVQRIDLLDAPDSDPSGRSGRFQLTLEDGGSMTAENVALALGFAHFTNVPSAFASLFPPERASHTCNFVDFSRLRDKRVLVVGGRQSAFEFTALMHEDGAKEVHLSYRHPTPSFRPSDWSWVNPLVDAIVGNPRWYRDLSPADKEDVSRRQWAEGRLKLEPWLERRITKDVIHLYPESLPTECTVRPGGDLGVTLSTGEKIVVDHVLLATGYQVDISRTPMLARGNALERLETRNGFPVLDECMQSNLAGLYLTSMSATQDFSPFFGFTVAVRTSARLIGDAVRRG